MGVSKQVLRRRVAAVVVAAVLSVQNSASASPAGPSQEDSDSEQGAAAGAVIDINVDVGSAPAADVVDALGEIDDNVQAQLDQWDQAEQAVQTAVEQMAAADLAISDTEFRIEELTIQSDAVVVETFMSPPAIEVIDTLTMENATEAAIKQGVLDIQADSDAHVLGQLNDEKEELEKLKKEQRGAREEAEEKKADAEQALDDLSSAVDQQVQFVAAVRERLQSDSDAAERLSQSDPALAARIEARRGEILTALQAIEQERAVQRAQEELERRRQEEIRRNGFLCPVDPPSAVNFADTWGAARSGGRTHKGTDMMAANGTNTVAPVNGRVVHRGTSLGGMSWYVYGDNGHTYYGTHLSGYENQGAGYVEAGTVIGYVGSSGNASASAPHLHFEYKPGGGSSINPYPFLVNACPGSAE